MGRRPNRQTWQSDDLIGEHCRLCGANATALVSAVIMSDDVLYQSHSRALQDNVKAPVCDRHLRRLFGDFAVEGLEIAREEIRKRSEGGRAPESGEEPTPP